MPESNVNGLDYYSRYWTEEIHSQEYAEWILDRDESVFVRMKALGDHEPHNYMVTAYVGTNNNGEQRDVGREHASDRATALQYTRTFRHMLDSTYRHVLDELEYNEP